MGLTKTQRILTLGFPFEVLNRDLKLVFACNLVGSFGDGLYAPLLPYYIQQTLHADGAEVGILYAVMSLCAASSLLLAGMLADRYDRKKIMIAGWVAWIPAPLIFSLGGDWLQMVPGMVLWGIWLGGPTGTAYIVTSADKSRLTLTFTAISAAWSFGYIFSPAIGGYLAATVGMPLVFYSASLLYAVASLILMFISSQRAANHTQPSTQKRDSFWKLLRTRKLLKFSVFFASVFFILMMFRPLVPLYLADIYGYGNFELGALSSVAFFGSAVLGILLGKLGDKWNRSYSLAFSMVFCSFSLILLVLFGNFYILTIAFFFTGGSYLTWSLLGAVVGPLAPEAIRARWVSIPQTVSMFSSFVAPYLGGILYDAVPAYPFIVAIVAAFFLSVLAFTRTLEK